MTLEAKLGTVVLLLTSDVIPFSEITDLQPTWALGLPDTVLTPAFVDWRGGMSRV